MTQNLPPPIPSLVRKQRRLGRTTRMAQRLLRWSGIARWLRRHAAVRRTGGSVAVRRRGSGTSADEDDGGAPWHDQTLPMPERMKLADGKPLRWRMMAAMAQQDCGQCGYDCKNYSGRSLQARRNG